MKPEHPQVALLHHALRADKANEATWRWYSDLVEHQRLSLRRESDQWIVALDGSDFSYADCLHAAVRWAHIMTHSGGYVTFAA